MSSYPQRFYPPSRPRKVEGGLKARSARGDIGATWWSRRFIDVLESFALGSRLTRGRNYARAGQVLSLDVTPGVVAAAVQGSRARPYQVTVAFPVFPELVWAKVEVILAEQAIHSARLLAGEMPPDLEEVFADAGAPLFPRALGELRLHCSCPDREVPCKHLAATFYLLAEAFDTDPFQILFWRGRSRQALLTRLRELRAVDPDPGDARPARRSGRTATVSGRSGGTVTVSGRSGADASPTAGEAVPVIGAALALADVAGTGSAVDPDRFWFPAVPLPARPPAPDADPDVLLRQLPVPGPALGGSALVAALAEAYLRFSEETGRASGSATAGDDPMR